MSDRRLVLLCTATTLGFIACLGFRLPVWAGVPIATLIGFVSGVCTARIVRPRRACRLCQRLGSFPIRAASHQYWPDAAPGSRAYVCPDHIAAVRDIGMHVAPLPELLEFPSVAHQRPKAELLEFPSLEGRK